MKIGGADQIVMITASQGRGRNARDGTVAGLDPASGKVLWTWQGWQNPIPVPQPVDAGNGRLLITGGYSIPIEPPCPSGFTCTVLMLTNSRMP